MASRIARSATLRGQTEPEPETKVGEPPEHLKEDAQVVWAEMTREGRLRLTVNSLRFYAESGSRAARRCGAREDGP